MIDIDGLLLRMQSTTGAMDFRHLASILGVTERNVRLWKQIGEVPIKILVVIAEDRDVSLDWLVFGLAGKRETAPGSISEMISSSPKIEFLEACRRAAAVITSVGDTKTSAEGLAAMMPGFLDADAATRALGVIIFREAKALAQLRENA